MTHDRALLDYLLRLADSDLILAQRLGEWVGKGPVIEEDIEPVEACMREAGYLQS